VLLLEIFLLECLLTKNDLLNLALAADIKLVNYTGRARKKNAPESIFIEYSHLLGTRCTRKPLNWLINAALKQK
jgi:hypothetical protein